MTCEPVLRLLRPGDAESVHRWMSDFEMVRYMLFPLMDRDASDRFLENAIRENAELPIRYLTLGIESPHQNRLIGLCGLDFHDETQDAESWYLLDRSVWGQGVGTVVLNELNRIAFIDYERHRVWATCLPENPGSARILEKTGYAREGYMRGNLLIHGQWRDSYHYALLRSDWKCLLNPPPSAAPLDVDLRQAVPDDAPELLTFLDELLLEDNLDIVLTREECRWTEDDERRILDEFQSADNSAFFIARMDGRICGVLDIRGGRRRMLRHAASLGISILKPYRGRGVGTRMMRSAIEWARATGILTRLELNVFSSNEPAIRLYRRLGFALEGIRRAAIIRDGRPIDDWLMALTWR